MIGELLAFWNFNRNYSRLRGCADRIGFNGWTIMRTPDLDACQDDFLIFLLSVEFFL
jgi:hypothetical protein